MNNINHKAYTDHATDYYEHNLQGYTGGLVPSHRVALFKKYLNSGKVLEIGSGAGLDAQELIKQGFTVIPSDFTDAFVEIMKANGLAPIKLDAVNDKFPQDLDGVFANAVFVHFSPEDSKKVIANIYESLKPNGIIFLSMLIGSGTEVSGKLLGIIREFFYYQPQDIEELLKGKFEILEMNQPVEGRWIHLVARKI